jgi:5-methylcytosine-specific restriction endonuclease McrA
MVKYKKVYRDFFGVGDDDVVLCEICDQPAVDLHHVSRKGMGGSKEKDYIENLMALCRRCHEDYGDRKEYMDFLKRTHMNIINKFKNGK